MARKKAKKAFASAKNSSKQDSRPKISVKVNESARIEKSVQRDELNIGQESKKQETPTKILTKRQAPVKKEARGQEPESNLKYAFIGILIVLAFIAATVFLKGNAGNNQDSNFPMLTNDTMVCSNNNAICFLKNGSWYPPGYAIGTDLSVSNRFYLSNETLTGINDLFAKDKINLAFGSANGSDPNNAQLITTASPFAYYLGVYYVYKDQNKTISTHLLSEYDSGEPALIILGPGTGAKETSIVFDGKNVVVQSESYEDLKLIIGRLLIAVIRGN
jgi:hypothetical protein